jgi:hypothetical protein
MALSYSKGVEIKKNDRVLLHREPVTVELVADQLGDPEAEWYIQEYGGGVAIVKPKVFGRLFLSAEQLSAYSDLVFVSRAENS